MVNTIADQDLCQKLLAQLKGLLKGRPLRFMEVCGTHTVAIFQSGLRSLLPDNVSHLSGPGCPVCVTHDSEIAAFLELALRKDVVLTTFGDLLRVPGPKGRSLKHARAEGARIELIYSPLEALTYAKKHPSDLVVFLGIGFETTAPAVAATILSAAKEKVPNFCVFSMHKLVPPVLRLLLEKKACEIDAFLLPGHVSTILGLAPYAFLVEDYGVPGAVAGFKAEDILLGLCGLASDLVNGRPSIRNAYPRAVADTGNPKALALLNEVFTPKAALWRGLGEIESSGLAIKPNYARYDACERLGITLKEVPKPAGCRCGDVLMGAILPKDCPLFGRVCTPRSPVGPCMVSTEGSCAAWYKYVGVQGG